MKINEFVVPKLIITGIGAMRQANWKQGKKALIVSDPMMEKLGNTQQLERCLRDADVPFVTYVGITSEPTVEMVENGAKMYAENECDFLVALGGGSVIDSMKAIATVVSSKENISSFLGKEINHELPKMIAIPTTAGTGSEATQFTIITDTENNIKMLLKGKSLIPDIAIVDPSFTLTAPPFVTAATGLDALCHAMESYASKKSQILSRTFSVSAMKRILTYLPQAMKNGSDAAAKEQMSIAALEAGIAFNNSSVTLIHGMSRPIGAIFHLPHGYSNAILLHECLKFMSEGQEKLFGNLAYEMGLVSEQNDDKRATEILRNEIDKLVEACQLPSLEYYHVNKDEFIASIPKMAIDALNSGSPGNTARECTVKDIEEIYRKLSETLFD